MDDHVSVRRMLAFALETAGYDVCQAGNEIELQRILSQPEPDALLIDLQRSEADGLKLLRRMRARAALRGVPIVFLAGTHDDAFRQEALRAGADWYRLRPLQLLELQNGLARLIQGAADPAHRTRHERVG